MVNVINVVIVCIFNFYTVSPSSIPLSKSKDAYEICTTPECVNAANEIIANLDLSADPCNDFYRFACGSWIDNNEIPPSMSTWGRFNELTEDVNIAIQGILSSPIDPLGSKAVSWTKMMYNACNDLESLETMGKEFFHSALTSNDSGFPMLIGNDWKEEQFDLETYITSHSGILLSIGVSPDSQNTAQNVIYLDQGYRLGLFRDMFIKPETFQIYIDAYKTFMKDSVKYLNTFIGSTLTDDFLTQSVENVFMFEEKLANIMISTHDRQNTTAMYNPMTLAEIKTKYSTIKWNHIFDTVFENISVITNNERIIVSVPKYFADLEDLLTKTPKRVLADYFYWLNVVYDLASEGPKDLVDIAFKFNSVYAGIKVPPTREHHCTTKFSAPFIGMGGMGFAISHEYLKTYFTDEPKNYVDNMVHALRFTFKRLVNESVWMDTETQIKANEKVDAILQHIAYPDWLKDKDLVDEYYETLSPPTLTTHIQNILNIRQVELHGMLSQLRIKPNKERWESHSAVVNAFYSPIKNSITFPAGILQSPFFTIGTPRYINFGAIGSVIGHEITHGFDDSGRQFDKYGNAIPWWSPETIQTFKKQAQCYVDQYNDYHISELESTLGIHDSHVNGQNTLGENIADNGGLHQAYQAYNKSIEIFGTEGRLPGLLQFTPEQVFFISYSQVWCQKITNSALLNQILSDPHSPAQYRVWGAVSNSPGFVSAFSCPPDSNMNRGDKQCILW